MDVLLVNEEGVAEVAFVLTKRLAVVAEDEEQRFVKQPARLQTAEKSAQHCVAVVQGVAIAADLVVPRKRSRRGSVVGMMPGHGQVSDEKIVAARDRINPIQHPFRRDTVIHAEAGFMMAANVSGIGQSLKSSVLHDLFHPEINKPAGVEQRCPITRAGEPFGHRWRADTRAHFRSSVERRVA